MVSTPSNQTSQRLVLVDGYGFVFRAYHSMPPLTRPDGTPVGAVYGFTNMLYKLKQEMNADYIAVILDAGSKTFRNEIYSEYKANRPPAPEDLVPQFPIVREAAEALNLAVIEKQGYEADDIIATYATQANEKGWQVTIVSSDKDLMQLVNDNVKMYDPMKSREIGSEQVNEKFGVNPDKVLDVLSLIGDSSDNVPGVPGIGPKTAAELIGQFGTLDEILANADQIKQNKRRENLLEFADQARLSRELITLCETVPVEEKLEGLQQREIDAEKLVTFLHHQGFKALIARVEKQFDVTASAAAPEITSKPPQQQKHPATLIDSEKALADFLDDLQPSYFLNIYPIASTQKDTPFQGLAISNENGKTAYITLPENEASLQQHDLFDTGSANQDAAGMSWSQIFTLLKPILEDTSIMKVAHDIKPLLRFCAEHDITLAPYDDIMIMSYILAGGLHGHDLASIVDACLDEPFQKLPDNKTLTSMSAEEQASTYIAYAEQGIGFVSELYQQRKQHLIDQHQLTLYERMERPLIGVLADMETAGIKVDPTMLGTLSEHFSTTLTSLEKEIYALAGTEFNIGSPKQLGEVLFEQMAIPGAKKTKTGAYTTSADVLEKIAEEGYDIADKVLSWRQIAKLKNTYSDALPKQINPTTNRIHTHFAQAVTNTGRLSSNDPNLQNIPIRSEEGQKIRQAFIARPGYKLISADYSQIELRLLAHLADMPSLQQAFAEGKDIHALTASEMFDTPIEGMDPLIRRRAKAINFGIIYGISAFGLARQLNISRSDAKAYIDHYYERYPGIRTYMDKIKSFARQHGYVETLLGRRCYIPEINSSNPPRKQFAERAAINAPLQGTAADIIKKAMIRLHHQLQAKKLDAKMVLQVHDELIIEAKEDCVEEASKLLKTCMEGVITLDTPLVVEVCSGDHWAEIH